MATSAPVAKASSDLWIVGILAMLWNAFGCYMYVLTMTRDPAAMAQADPAMRAAIEAAPTWSNAAWAFGVWGGLAGSLLLLARLRLAVSAFVVSLLGVIVLAAYQLLWKTPMVLPLQVTIWVIALFLPWYARRKVADGTLR